MLKPRKAACLLMLLLAGGGCQSPSRLPAAQLQDLQPKAPEAQQIQRHEPNFLTRLQDFLSGSPLKPTP
ncbi:hypothetical protein FuraDRAFT_0298 [Pseudogulbenkiania ferrooxidans 2002]|uniref:Lipoprotein n=1 Tax=Pseudogulbenkiania ferrooxidans 2002 TaxID=279714 RepID=B9YYW3_9NEIS|nr:hypothetical protein FuraDRAFT_0298 [Pseudogulbenkiania ferrooxidans 2002]